MVSVAWSADPGLGLTTLQSNPASVRDFLPQYPPHLTVVGTDSDVEAADRGQLYVIQHGDIEAHSEALVGRHVSLKLQQLGLQVGGRGCALELRSLSYLLCCRFMIQDP